MTAVPECYEIISKCMCCESTQFSTYAEVKATPIMGDRFMEKAADKNMDTLYLKECQSCGFRLQTPRPTEQALLAVIDKDYPHRPLNKIRRRLFENDLKLLSKHLERGKLLVDVGCNTGEFLNIAKNHFNVVGLDPIQSALNVGKREFGLKEMYHGTLKDLPKNISVDAIVSLDTFEHLHDPELFLSIASERLKKGGILYIRTIRREGPNARLSGKYWYAHSIWHLIYPTIEDVKKLCNKHGFETLEIEITRSGYFYLKASVIHHAKILFGTIFPFKKSFREYKENTKRWKRDFSFYRDEFAIVVRKK